MKRKLYLRKRRRIDKIDLFLNNRTCIISLKFIAQSRKVY